MTINFLICKHGRTKYLNYAIENNTNAILSYYIVKRSFAPSKQYKEN